MKKHTGQILRYVLYLVIVAIVGFICVGIPLVVDVSASWLIGGWVVYISSVIVLNDLIINNK